MDFAVIFLVYVYEPACVSFYVSLFEDRAAFHRTVPVYVFRSFIVQSMVILIKDLIRIHTENNIEIPQRVSNVNCSDIKFANVNSNSENELSSVIDHDRAMHRHAKTNCGLNTTKCKSEERVSDHNATTIEIRLNTTMNPTTNDVNSVLNLNETLKEIQNVIENGIGTETTAVITLIASR